MAGRETKYITGSTCATIHHSCGGPWVTTEAGRVSRLGVPLDCLRCDRFEVPEDVVPTSHTPEFTERTIPDGLKANHGHGPRRLGPDHRDGRDGCATASTRSA